MSTDNPSATDSPTNLESSRPSSKDDDAKFIYVICQNGGEAATKLELMSNHPELKLAFSRPGFITFKAPQGVFAERFSLRSTLARTYGWSLGKVTGENAGDLVEQIFKVPQLSQAKHVHVWQRDPVIPGRNGFEPGVSALAQEVGGLFQASQSDSSSSSNSSAPPMINRVAQPEDFVFDVVMVEPNEWWYGYHFADTVAQRWPGGAPLFDTTAETYSRAYFKLKEALLWSGISIKPGDVCAEIGSAPGGASQLLLEMGAHVIGIDPAEMEQEILDHENFTFIRRRSSEVKKRDLSEVKWLTADVNAAPQFTLDAISEFVEHPSIDIKGVILTIKLLERKLILQIPELMVQLKKLGFQVVKSRQLAFNRNEFCLVGVKDKFILRSGKQAKKPAKPRPRKKEAAD